MTVYIAGKITGDPGYRAKFKWVEAGLEGYGYTPISPAWLPAKGFSYRGYLRMGQALLRECQAICLMPGWQESNGAVLEAEAAVKKGLMVMEITHMGQGDEDLKLAFVSGSAAWEMVRAAMHQMWVAKRGQILAMASGMWRKRHAKG